MVPAGFLRRSLIASALLGLLGGVFAAVYFGPGVAGRYLLFLAWQLTNLLIWSASIRELLGNRRPALLVPLASLKFLWLALILLLCRQVGISGTARLWPFLLGFNTPFLVMLLKCLGSVLTGQTQARDISS